MKKLKVLILSLLVSLLVWAAWSWPLPRYVSRGLPMTHSGGRGRTVLYMEAGDHLQLLYHFWIFADMLAGNTPWMHNLYEFHAGDDAARYEPGPYYAPFSWIYALLAAAGSRALAYNLSGLASIWITYLLTWLLVRRYSSSGGLAAVVSILTVMVPYRWITLLGGSPTGFAMAAPPLLLWGLDRAVRDRSFPGGLWAGLAVLIGFSSDGHTFYFNLLLTPGWCLVALLAGGGPGGWKPRDYLKTAAALLPVAAAVLVTGLYSLAIRERLAGSLMAEGRTLEEVGIYAPQLGGVIGRGVHYASEKIFLGWAALILLLAGGAAAGLRLFTERPRPVREALIYLLLLGGAAAIVMLATGPFGPHGGVFWRKAREWLPNYNMIRQTAKIYAIMPTILAVLAALAADSLSRLLRFRPAAYLAAGAAVLLAGWEYGRRVDPVICELTYEQPVYRAVAEDAAERGLRPHILAVPLWPGDAHFASIYQYYCSLYRILMINGYTPAVESRYFDDVFLPYMSVNQGWLTGEQADSLAGRGITHLIFHEDLFPAKVSPFPHGRSLRSLLDNPGLEFLDRDGPVWALRLRAGDNGETTYQPGTGLFFPSLHWSFQTNVLTQPGGYGMREDASAGRGHYLGLREIGDPAEFPAAYAPPAPDLRWTVRARGRGLLRADLEIDGRTVPAPDLAVDAADWTHLDLPVPLEGFSRFDLELRLESGTVDLCSAFLTAGERLRIEPGETLVLPAGWFFHRGSTDLDTGAVSFRGGIDRMGAALWGPQLPLPEGRYEIGLDFESPAPPGTWLGGLQAEQLLAEGKRPIAGLIAGRETRLGFAVRSSLPFNLILHFDSNADVTVRSLTIRRLPPPEEGRDQDPERD